MSDRFWNKVHKIPNGCWEWTANLFWDGYGQFMAHADGKRVALRAHRWAYENIVGRIPKGMVIDHLCRNRKCVNPIHLEPVTVRENNRRGVGPAKIGAFHAAKTHCPHGHEYSDINTYIATSGQRQCRACTKERMQKQRTLERMRRGVEGKHIV